MWIVMTSSAKMPVSVKHPYVNVALVKLNQHYTARNLRPKMISERARGVLQVRHLGHHPTGKTEKCGFRRAKADAERLAFELNNAPTVGVHDEILASWGGSA